ncbi:hypothetical protein SK854_45650 [Lentzea sp. BCCO 10_0061]|uniref:Uncharacterized protein n=1 Tax=Lentzea sokolovensis TaxID=3095429 RepID=A0ABU4VER3_9PSEU|nr:hypothetical protein [Lentzea sp. BCCO 10_0061]MDX8149476.1 hypothetical protein [Lentzea sp. BCCO 10_0061]
MGIRQDLYKYHTDQGTPYPNPDWTPSTAGAAGDPWNPDAVFPWQPPPPVPGGVDTPGQGLNVVNVDAIITYANNLEALQPFMTNMIDSMDFVLSKRFGAGAFGAANNLEATVVGNGGQNGGASLVGSIRSVLVEAETIMKDMVVKCREIAAKYKTADDLTKLDADDFKQIVTGVNAKISGLSLGAAK